MRSLVLCPELVGRAPLSLLEDAAEVAGVLVAHGQRHLSDELVGGQEEAFGLIQAQVDEVFFEGHPPTPGKRPG